MRTPIALAEFPELKITGWFERIRVTPSRRAAAILRSRRLAPPYRVVEAFAGGGTMTAALAGNVRFCVEAGIEIDPAYSDEWQAAHPNAALVQADTRAVESSDLPPFDILIGGISPSSVPTSADVLFAIAEEHQGYFTSKQAAAAGYPPGNQAHHVKSVQLTNSRRG